MMNQQTNITTRLFREEDAEFVLDAFRSIGREG